MKHTTKTPSIGNIEQREYATRGTLLEQSEQKSFWRVIARLQFYMYIAFERWLLRHTPTHETKQEHKNDRLSNTMIVHCKPQCLNRSVLHFGSKPMCPMRLYTKTLINKKRTRFCRLTSKTLWRWTERACRKNYGRALWQSVNLSHDRVLSNKTSCITHYHDYSTVTEFHDQSWGAKSEDISIRASATEMNIKDFIFFPPHTVP